MTDWYYAEGGDPNGPHSTEDVRSLLMVEQINADTLLWRDGMAGWTRASELPEFADAVPKKAPPPIPVTPARIPPLAMAAPTPDGGWTHSQPEPPAATENKSIFVGNTRGSLHVQGGPWSRYFAKQLDLTIWLVIASLVVGFILPFVSANLAIELSSTNSFTYGLIMLVPAVLLNGIVSGIFGRSIGKAMFGLRPVPVDGRPRLTFAEHIVREFRVWFAGLAIGIPIIALFTMWKNFSEVSVGRPATYDRQFAKMEVTRIGSLRRSSAMLFAGLVVFGTVAGGYYVEYLERQRSFSPTSWTNPQTGRSMPLFLNETAESVTLDDGSTMFAFQVGSQLVAYLAWEDDPSGALTMEQYVDAMRGNLTDVEHLSAPAPVNVDGLSMVKWSAKLRSEGWPGAYFVFKQGDRFWRIIVFRLVGGSSADEERIPVVGAIKRTIVP